MTENPDKELPVELDDQLQKAIEEIKAKLQ